MASWDIKPQGVQGQLKTVGTHAGELEKALTALVADMAEAAQAAGTAVPGSMVHSGAPLQGPVAVGQAPLRAKATGPVAAALGEYLGNREPDFKAMAERIEASILGAATATNEYIEGDLEAAKHAQDAAKAVQLEALREAAGGHS
ncbi:DUF6507 family protein [Streptomyces sp. SID3212]|uniref:DUF6507 family protein n=1 Tax=unclassified Streptomyces TaxID=2593676 RepID=UPI001370F7C7|nr:DUF6507 family protein [Streptomyces sp. SID3212]MYV57706.1 hypothetical protein [Streptomyces sp. SID3212]